MSAILGNVKYAGYIEYVFTIAGKHVLTPGDHPAIVERPLRRGEENEPKSRGD